jgi:hypothetical protein
MIKLLAALAAMLITQGVFYALDLGILIIVTWVVIAILAALITTQAERGSDHAADIR